MKSAIRKGWRDSAALILLNKRLGDVQKSQKSATAQSIGAVNYEVLLQTRPSTGSFPNSAVFPGGVTEAADGVERWLQLFKSYGFGDQDFGCLHRAGTPTNPIFQPNPIQRHVALRITAIRETFEELGLLICSRNPKNQRGQLWASSISDVDVKYWQDRIAKDPAEFFNLCTETSCYPDIWSLFYWSDWLSPKSIPKRFDAAFFLAALETRPETYSNSEVVKVEWSSPLEVLKKNIAEGIELYPPQKYELIRLLHIPDIQKLLEFAKNRNGYCDDLIYPVKVKAKDGIVWLYPGDNLYPSTVDYYTDEINLKHKTLEELRKETKVIHRLEQSYEKPTKWQFVTKGLKRNNHIDMGDKTYLTFSTQY